MKIKIELELNDEEIPKATELLRVLNQLTNKVEVKQIPNSEIVCDKDAEENLKKKFKKHLELLLKSSDSQKLIIMDTIIVNISKIFSETNLQNRAKLFYQSLKTILDNESLILKQIPIQHYVYIVAHLKIPQTVKNQIFDLLFDEAVHNITKERNPNSNRIEFYASGTIFAALMKIQYFRTHS
eukprot:gene6080-10088_t